MSVQAGTRLLHAFILIALLAIAAYQPYRVFGVLPYAREYRIPQAEIDRLLTGLNLPDYYAESRGPFTAADVEQQRQESLWCRFCHTLRQGEAHRVGPNLNRILGKPAGVVTDFAYSAALLRARDNGVVWTPETLDSFLSDPHNYVPGNRMRFEPIADSARRRRIIEYLIRETR